MRKWNRGTEELRKPAPGMAPMEEKDGDGQGRRQGCGTDSTEESRIEECRWRRKASMEEKDVADLLAGLPMDCLDSRLLRGYLLQRIFFLGLF